MQNNYGFMQIRFHWDAESPEWQSVQNQIYTKFHHYFNLSKIEIFAPRFVTAFSPRTSSDFLQTVEVAGLKLELVSELTDK